jgi:hypothetical protein
VEIFCLPILVSKNILEFKRFFNKEYVRKKLFMEGFEIKVYKEDFFHICFEKGKGGTEKQDFSIRRSGRLLAIREICEGRIPYTILYQHSRKNKSICILSKDAECAFYMRMLKEKGRTYFKLLTFIVFGKNVGRKIASQLRASVKKRSLGSIVR